MNHEVHYPKFSEALKFWLKLGFISFGGPAGQIAIMHNFLVAKKKWISESRFMHALNYCMLLPGPEAQQLAIYTGWLMHGTRGGVAAGVLFVIPSMFILLGLSIFYVSFGHVPLISAAFTGLKAAVVAIIFQALIKIGRKSLKSNSHYAVALLTFLAIFIFDVPFPLLIASAILIGFMFALQEKRTGIESGKISNDDSGYVINDSTINRNARIFGKEWKATSIVLTICWIIPFLVLLLVAHDPKFWTSIVWLFTRAALVTFGGAYAVLPYVARISVEDYQWLSSMEMLDGLALGETTPGPLIMVLSFVGFMAGYHHFGNSLAMGAMGLMVTTWYTFLPCFFFILLGAPVIERTRDMKFISGVLSYVTAAVTGAILCLGLYFALALVFPDKVFTSPHLFSLIWITISLILLMRFKTGILSLIGISILAGIVFSFINRAL